MEQPETKIPSSSSLTPQAELALPNPHQPLLVNWEGSVHNHFSDQARRVPENLAVVDAQGAWSYKELEEYANQLSNYLSANGIQSQDIVAIYAHRSASLVWAILGILKVGAAFMVLDPAYPDSRLIECLQVAKPRAFIKLEATREISAAVKDLISTLSCCCTLNLPQGSTAAVDHLLGGYSTKELVIPIDPEQLAYVAFTSGSTGKPKGILGTHRPLSHFLKWHCETFGFNQSDRFSAISGLSHDPLLRDIFTPLSIGATLYIPEQKDIETPGQLANWMEKQQVSVTHLTPAMGQLLTEARTEKAIAQKQIPSLRYLFFGGDVLTKQDIAQILNIASKATCVNFYGATETPQAMGYFIIPNDNRVANLKDRIPIGRGIADVQLLILNNEQNLAGIEEVGEIYIRTPYLAKGYMEDEQRTQERFIVNPFTNNPEDRLYKTGDLGCYLPDGNIECLGRIDNQVKIRGFRIELTEIEGCLIQHPHVRETTVIAREDRPTDKRLVAYIIPNQQVPTTSELRHFLKEKLPDYMVPAAFVILEALPLTPNGKVDRNALPVPDLVRQHPEESFVAPRDSLELLLTKIWEKVLGIQPISVRDNFFELGGHSLLALRLLTQIEKNLGKNLPLSTFLEVQTIEQLANLLQQQESSAPWQALVKIQPGNSSKYPLFCVHAIWGNVLFYRELVKYLDPQQPFYGIQARGLDGKQEPCTSITEMAASYIKEIQTVQQQGPYFLAGHSFGGTVAFEMARQLHEQGEKVALLAILDTVALAYWQPTFRASDTQRPTFGKQILFSWRKFLTLSIKYQLIFVWEKVVWHLTLGKLNLFYTMYLQYIKRSLHDLRLIKVGKANNQAEKSYIPQQTYPGKLTLFRAIKQPLAVANDPQLGWGNLVAGGVNIYDVPGSHTTILHEPNVKVLAEKLTDCLHQIQLENSNIKPVCIEDEMLL